MAKARHDDRRRDTRGSARPTGRSQQGRYGGMAPYSKHANEHNYWAGYDEDRTPQAGKAAEESTRSDERIREHICAVLSEDAHVDVREIAVQVENGEATLRGTVDDRSTSRRAEDLVAEIGGVDAVRNNLRIKERG